MSTFLFIKVHKVTLCQAEGMTKKNRFGKLMTDEELEQNRFRNYIQFNFQYEYRIRTMNNNIISNKTLVCVREILPCGAGKYYEKGFSLI